MNRWLIIILNKREIAYFSVKSFLTSRFICFLDSLLASLSSETTVLRSISVATKYLVGIRWL